jgi:hypothetical protein
MADAADDRAARTLDRGEAQTAEAGHLGGLRREREIAQVLARHGLVFLGHVLGLDRLDSALHHEPSSEAAVPAQELRRALAELGPTFIKLGQLLSTRADLLSDDYRRELEKLQDAAPPAPAAAISEIVDSELPGGVAGSFAKFETQPLAADRQRCRAGGPARRAFRMSTRGVSAASSGTPSASRRAR